MSGDNEQLKGQIEATEYLQNITDKEIPTTDLINRDYTLDLIDRDFILGTIKNPSR